VIGRLILVALFLLACGVRTATAASCTVYGSGISFGNYSANNTVNVTGTVTVTCTLGTAYNVGLNAGMAAGATVTNRSMTTGPVVYNLGYQLFSNSARTNNWGDTSGTGWVAGTGLGLPQTLTIYAQIPASQFVAPGTYTDTITVSVTGSGFTTATGQFGLTSTVLSACTVSANALNFGVYSGSLINAASAITVTCTNNTTFNIGLNAGTAAGATVTTRKMTSPSHATLSYTLFRDSARTQNWGNTVGTDTLISQGNGTPLQYGVFGQLPAGQSATPAVYTDTITATITY
jgi:spore coat protein U-like protein